MPHGTIAAYLPRIIQRGNNRVATFIFTSFTEPALDVLGQWQRNPGGKVALAGHMVDFQADTLRILEEHRIIS